MPGAWAALRPDLATPRGADLNYLDGTASSRRRAGSASSSSTSSRVGPNSRNSSSSNVRGGRRQPPPTHAGTASEQLWQQAELALRAESAYAPDPSYHHTVAAPRAYQPSPVAAPGSYQLPPHYVPQTSPKEAQATPPQAPSPSTAGFLDSGRSPLPISRVAVRATSSQPLPGREQVIVLRGGEAHPAPLISLWRSNSYSDVDVIVEGQAFYAHRLVLAAGSDYLSALVENSPPLPMRQRRCAAPCACRGGVARPHTPASCRAYALTFGVLSMFSRVAGPL